MIVTSVWEAIARNMAGAEAAAQWEVPAGWRVILILILILILLLRAAAEHGGD